MGLFKSCFYSHELTHLALIVSVLRSWLKKPQSYAWGEILEYFKRQEAILVDAEQNHNISSDIIESDFGIYKEKKSPSKLYGITPFVLLIPLHAKHANESVTKTFNFKKRLCNVKLKDIDAFAKEHMSKNRVTERIKTLKNVG